MFAYASVVAVGAQITKRKKTQSASSMPVGTITILRFKIVFFQIILTCYTGPAILTQYTYATQIRQQKMKFVRPFWIRVNVMNLYSLISSLKCILSVLNSQIPLLEKPVTLKKSKRGVTQVSSPVKIILLSKVDLCTMHQSQFLKISISTIYFTSYNYLWASVHDCRCAVSVAHEARHIKIKCSMWCVRHYFYSIDHTVKQHKVRTMNK